MLYHNNFFLIFLFINTLIFSPKNREHNHRTEVYVMIVTEELEEWEDSRAIGRKRQWFTVDEALEQLALHKPVQRHYLQQLKRSKLT